MKEQQIWIKTMDSAAEVGNLILALFEEDEDYSGEMRVLVGKPESGGYEKLKCSEVQLMKKAWDLEQKERSDERTANMD